LTPLSPPPRHATTLADLPAPAKINLFLHVLGQRDDGYHLLQSVFGLIDWHDRLTLSLRNDGVVAHTQPTPGLPANDLCVRAAHALQQATGCRLGAHITLHKAVPMQAGLGGGSSNAATCLLGLNRLWQLGLTRAELQTLAVSLGADVPFFLFGQSAWVEGVGERLQPISLPAQTLVVVKPPTGVATAAVFAHPELERATPSATMRDFAAGVIQGLTAFGRNDLQGIAQRLCPDIAHALQWLHDQGLKGRLSGSGSAVFAPLPLGHALRKPPATWLVRTTRLVDMHPLAEWVD
jgi:4-diphosphocytidyl-2-C-methyl-D-erythritol kinase